LEQLLKLLQIQSSDLMMLLKKIPILKKYFLEWELTEMIKGNHIS